MIFLNFSCVIFLGTRLFNSAKSYTTTVFLPKWTKNLDAKFSLKDVPRRFHILFLGLFEKSLTNR